jgi:hypothetical protein
MRMFKNGLFIVVFIAAHIFILRNVILLSNDMLFGTISDEKIFPVPRYPFARIPDTSITEQYNAQNRVAVDFAQIYFPAQQMASLGENYQTGYLDPLERPSRYAPLVHYLCSITICRLDYGIASLLHMAIQGLLFYLAFIISFKVLKMENYILPGILLVNIYLFLTPAGLSWLERGQFSLYVGIAYLLMILGLLKKNLPLVLLSALFAFIKWTSLPFIFVIFCVYIFNSKNLAEGRKNLLWAAAFLLIIIGLTFSFPLQSIDFLKGLYLQERFAVPGGVSLAKVLPVGIAKFLPVPVIVLGYLHLKINRNLLERSIPFLTGAAILMLTYPTLAYEYNLPSLLGFIPLFFYWTKFPDNPVNTPVREVLKYSFLVFLLSASFSNYIGRNHMLIIEYMLILSILLLFPLFDYWLYTWGPKRPKIVPAP